MDLGVPCDKLLRGCRFCLLTFLAFFLRSFPCLVQRKVQLNVPTFGAPFLGSLVLFYFGKGANPCQASDRNPVDPSLVLFTVHGCLGLHQAFLPTSLQPDTERKFLRFHRGGVTVDHRSGQRSHEGSFDGLPVDPLAFSAFPNLPKEVLLILAGPSRKTISVSKIPANVPVNVATRSANKQIILQTPCFATVDQATKLAVQLPLRRRRFHSSGHPFCTVRRKNFQEKP